MFKDNVVKRTKYLLYLITTLLLICIPSKIFADEISFVVSPSKIVDYKIEPGETKDIVFTIGNKSKFPSEHKEKNELYKFKINITAKLEDSDGFYIDTKDILKFDKTSVECKPNEVQKIKATISIPKDFEKNFYKLYINFEREPIENIETSESIIKAPIFLFVGDEAEFSKLKPDFDVTEFYMDFGNQEKGFITTIANNLKRLITLNPISVIDTFKDIKHSPVHSIVNNKDELIVDVNNELLVTINNVVTEDNVNDWEYVLATQEQLSKKVLNVNFKDNRVEFVLENKDVIVVEGTSNTINFIKKQINNILPQIKGTPILNDLFCTIKVPINKNYDIFTQSAFVNIKNTGEKDIHIDADFSLLKDNSTVISEGEIKTLTINLGKQEKLNVPLSVNGDLTSGDYQLTGNFVAGNKVNKTYKDEFKVDTLLSEKIFYTTLITYLLLIIILIILIIKLINLLKKYRIGYVKATNLRKLNNYELTTLYIQENEEDIYRAILIDEVSVRYKPNNSSKVKDVLLKDTYVELFKSNKIKDSEWIKIKYKINKNK